MPHLVEYLFDTVLYKAFRAELGAGEEQTLEVLAAEREVRQEQLDFQD